MFIVFDLIINNIGVDFKRIRVWVLSEINYLPKLTLLKSNDNDRAVYTRIIIVDDF